MASPTSAPGAVIDAVIGVEDAIGNFIADGPSTGIQGHIRDQYRKRCNQFANAPGWAQALANAPSGSLGRICQPWYDAQNVDAPTLAPPFEGGQCAIDYFVNGTYTAYETDGSISFTSPFQVAVRGPVGGLSFTSSGCGPVIGPLASGARGFCGFVSGGGITQLAFGNGNGGVNGSISSVVPQSPVPDDCDDPPPELQPGPNPPPNPGPTDGPDPTDDPNNPTGPPLLPIPPYIDPIGGPTPIVGPDPNAPAVDPDTIPGNTDSQEGGPENVGEPIEVNPGPSGGGDDTEFGEPPDGKVWVGCLLQFDIPEAYGNIAGSGPANTVTARVFGNASLVFANGRGTAYRVNSSNIDLFRSSGALKVTGVYVNVAPGITYNVRPVSVDKCPENSCGAA